MTVAGDDHELSEIDVRDDRKRVLPLVADRGNRRVLVDWLRDRYEVVTAADPDRTLREEAIDLCILDRASFEEHRDVLIDRKETAEPRIVPYLLVCRETTVLSDPDVRKYVDDAIVTPIGRRELTQRVESLLRLRKLSHELEAKNRELQRKNEELKRKNEKLEYLLNSAAHDLRNPLTVALGYAGQFEDDAAEELESALRRMEALVENFLAIPRTEGTPSTEALEPIPFATLLSECWEVVPTEDADLEVASDDETRVLAVPDLLDQLVENLLRNAIEHGGDDVTVRAGTLSNRDGFFVADDGPGIPSDETESIFEEGYSTNAGNGLGLAIVKRVADAHGWDVRVTESEAGGARFEIVSVEIER